MRRMYLSGLLVFIISLFIGSCAQRSVTRLDPSQQTDLSGRWNDTDSRLVAEEMIQDVLTRRWREDFHNRHNKRPVIIVGTIANRSHEHIEAETFVKDMEREFVNSGLVRVVQNDDFREKLRDERADQGQFASPETQSQWGKELGADFMLFGTLNSIVDTHRNQRIVYYKINLELADLTTNEKVWIGDKEIKKFVRN